MKWQQTAIIFHSKKTKRESENFSVVSNSLRPHGLQSARLLCPRNSPVRILEWVAIPFSRGSSWPRDQTLFSCIAGRFFTIWTTKGARTSHRVTKHLTESQNKGEPKIKTKHMTHCKGLMWLRPCLPIGSLFLLLFPFCSWRKSSSETSASPI